MGGRSREYGADNEVVEFFGSICRLMVSLSYETTERLIGSILLRVTITLAATATSTGASFIIGRAAFLDKPHSARAL